MNRSSHRMCSIKKAVLKNFAIFTGKHLCQSLFFNKVAGLKETPIQVFPHEYCEILRISILKNICEHLLLRVAIFKAG